MSWPVMVLFGVIVIGIIAFTVFMCYGQRDNKFY